MNLAELVALLGQINTMLPVALAIEQALMKLFDEMTAGLSNEERIALLAKGGITLDTKGAAWFSQHGLTP